MSVEELESHMTISGNQFFNFFGFFSTVMLSCNTQKSHKLHSHTTLHHTTPLHTQDLDLRLVKDTPCHRAKRRSTTTTNPYHVSCQLASTTGCLNYTHKFWHRYSRANLKTADRMSTKPIPTPSSEHHTPITSLINGGQYPESVARCAHKCLCQCFCGLSSVNV